MNPTGFAQATAHAETGADLAIIPGALVPAEVFADGGVDRILADLKARAKSEPVDISTPQGRAALKSLCYKIARSKTALDGMGKDLGENHNAKWTAINKDRKRIRDDLDALNEEIRAPLTEWEAKDYARIMAHETAIQEIGALIEFAGDPEISEIERRIDHVRGDDREWQEFSKRAQDFKIATVAELIRMRERWSNVYAERAEAERLRAEEAARVQRERDAAIAAAAAEQAKREAEAKAAAAAHEAAENARLAREAIERRARQEAEAAEAKRRNEAAAAEAAREAEAERVRREAAAAEASRLAEVRARQEAEERARQAEESRIAAAQRAEQQRTETAAKAEQDRLAAIANERRLIEEERLAAARDAAAREANQKHRLKINQEAQDAIVRILLRNGVSGSGVPLAHEIVSAIAKGLIPHTRIIY